MEVIVYGVDKFSNVLNKLAKSHNKISFMNPKVRTILFSIINKTMAWKLGWHM